MNYNQRMRRLALYILILISLLIVAVAESAVYEDAEFHQQKLTVDVNKVPTKVEKEATDCDAETIIPEPEPEPEDEGTYLGVFTITHYCPGKCCNGKWAGQTSSGAKPTPWHTIAVDPSVIPMWSTVYIEGYGEFVAQDSGGAIKGNRIDVLVSSHEEGKRLGVKEMKVYLK